MSGRVSIGLEEPVDTEEHTNVEQGQMETQFNQETYYYVMCFTQVEQDEED